MAARFFLLEARAQNPVVRGQKPDDSGQMTEYRSQWLEDERRRVRGSGDNH